MRSCALCGAGFEHAQPAARFCSAVCRAEAERRRRRAHEAGRRQRRSAEMRAKIGTTGCAECGVSFVPSTTLAKFCSDACRYRNRDARVETRERHDARKRALQEAGMAPLTGFRNARACAEWYGAEFEEFDPVEVFERDGWVCGICHDSIDSARAWPDRMSASIDHIVPWSRGGAHTRGNVQASHLICNIRKGAEDIRAVA